MDHIDYTIGAKNNVNDFVIKLRTLYTKMLPQIVTLVVRMRISWQIE